MTGGIIDQLWIALSIKPDTSGLKEVRARVNEAKESLLSVGGAIKAFVAGFAIKEIADIGSTFEQNQIQIAGFFAALGESSDFNAGLKDAATVMQQITKDAAALPGEADDYIETFKRGFSFIKGGMPGASISEMAAFSDRLTAIGIGWKLDAGIIAREFDHMLAPGRGMASSRLPFFVQLLPYMQKVKKDAGFTAEKFNAMTAPDRLKLLQQVIGSMDPMLKAMEGTFDAMWGSAVSTFKMLTRLATAPLFEKMKDGLKQVSDALYGEDGKPTAFGKSIAESVATATKYLGQLLAVGGRLLMWFAQSKVGAVAFKTVIALLGTALAGLAVEKTVGTFTKLFKVMTNLKALMGGALFTAIALIAEDLYVFYTGGNSVTGLLAKKFPDAFAEAGAVVKVLWRVLTDTADVLKIIGDVLLVVASNSDVLTVALVALAAIFAPEATLFAGAWALGRQIGELIIQFLKLIGLAHQLGFLAEEPEALKNFKGGAFDKNKRIGDDDSTDFLTKLPDGIRRASSAAQAPWQPWSPADGSGMGQAGSTSTHVNQTTHNTINIKSTDPKAAGREVQRALTRNGQTGVKY